MINYLLACLPSFLHVTIRRFLGASIQKGVKIKLGTIIRTKQLNIGSDTSLGPFCYLSGDIISIDKDSTIKPLTIVSAKEILIGKCVHIAPLAYIGGDHTNRSFFKIGDHSRVFPFCWLDTGEGIRIGKHVGIGGHTLIFTHGVWSDFLDGGPISYAGVEIEDYVWLPWRVFIMPGTKIGAKSIIGANSLVSKSIPENVVAAGSPAKVLKENVISNLQQDEKILRVKKILEDYAEYSTDRWDLITDGLESNSCLIKLLIGETKPEKDCLYFLTQADTVAMTQMRKNKASFISHLDKTFYYSRSIPEFEKFVQFLRRYGIRLYQVKY